MFEFKSYAEIHFAPKDAKYSEQKRFWQGCPTVAVAEDGNIATGWYTGGTKEPSQYIYNVLYHCSADGKLDEFPLLTIDTVADSRCLEIDIQLWHAPDGNYWVFWTQRDYHYTNNHPNHLSVWGIHSKTLLGGEASWSKPQFISNGFLRTQPLALKDGRYLLFSYDWVNDRYNYSESSDCGKTWTRKSGGKKVETSFDEGQAVEKLDGTIHFLARANNGFIAESESKDSGKTWTDGKATAFAAPSSRLFYKRLKSGNLLLIHNDSEDKTRKNIVARLSADDGKTWPYYLPVDMRMHVTYPDAAEDNKGNIYIVNDCGRVEIKEMLLSKVTEKDIMSGHLVTPGSYLARVISKAPEEPYDKNLFNAQAESEKTFFAADRIAP